MFNVDDEQNPEERDPNAEEEENLEENGEETEEGGEESSEQSEKQSKSGTKTGGVAKDIAKKKIEKEAKQKILTKMGTTKLMSLLAPILPYLGIALLIILLIIILIGIIMFLLMLPGILMGKITALVEGAAKALESFWEGKEDAAVDTEDIIGVADYLENMGYDLKEYGFVTSPVEKASFDGSAEDAYIDDSGIGRNADGITNINSEVIRTYLVSDNYVYCCKNFNKNVKEAFSSLGSFFSGLFFDSINWGTGLIGIYKEDKSFWGKDKIGQAGASYSNGFFNKYDIDVDAEAKTLNIKTKTGFLGLGRGRTFTYNLEGWTARYGMPIEFLLAVHLTSMSPDLAVDLATSFDTEVVILLHETTSNVQAAYKTESGDMLDRDQLIDVTGNVVSKKDTAKVFASTSLTSPDSCTNEDGLCSTLAKSGELTKACAACEDFVESIRDDLNALADKSLDTFIPYISKVTDHWFRDVYFVADKEQEVVMNDKEYEAQTKERWTDYEHTYDEDGNIVYSLYKLNDDGSLSSEKYEGTQEDAEKEGIKVAKKAVTEQVQNIAEEGTIVDDEYWSAYKFEDTAGTWQLYADQAGEGEDSIDINNKENVYIKIDIMGNVTQIQDAQRGVTNPTIKQIFSTNKYYMYDGKSETADAIAEDREATKNDRDKDNTAEDKRNPDLIGSFTVDRDSLTAFNILENMNTFDADSIYRDFKELIVELDYFDKEELTQNPTVVWEWPIPECGSGGWPIRRFEKVENEFGTLINSKVDLENLKKKNEASIEIVKTGKGDEGDQTQINDGSAEPVEETVSNAQNLELAKEEKFIKEKNEQDNVIDGNLINPIAGLEALYASSGGGSGSGYQGSTFIETAKNVWEHVVNGNYTYDQSYGKAVPVPEPHIDCSAYVSWALYEYGYDDFGGGQASTVTFMTTDWNAKYGWEVIDVAAGEDCSGKLQEGDILVREGEGTHHVQIIKEIDPSGNVIVYDCGSTSNWSQENLEGMVYNSFSKTNPAPGKIIRVEDPSNKGVEFKGYEGYQDVVSPISGEIIEAGTTTINNIETGVEEDVGFIKIRALSEEDVEAYFNSEDETLEGYKYYLEEYERAGVCDYILYIEGFDLRIVNENLQLTNDPAIIDESTAEVKNSYTESTFEDVLSPDVRETLEEKEEKRVEAKSVVQADGKIFVKEGTVLGKTYTDGADAEANTEGEEGAETEPLPDDAKERPGISKIPEDQKTMTTDDGEVIDMPNGNYIRLILRSDETGGGQGQDKDSIVENIEDYLEIDNGEEDLDLDWEFFYWVPYESGPVGEEGVVNNPPIGSGQCAIASWNSSEAAAGIAQWTCLSDGGANNIPEVCKKLIELDSAFCGSLSAFTEWSASTVVSNFSQVQAAWHAVYAQDPDKFLDLQMQVCYEGDFKPLVESMGMEWILQRPMVVQGTLFSCMNYCPYPEAIGHTAWSTLINDSMDDSAIIDAVLNQAGNIGSTAGSLAGRFHEAQPKIAHDILDGTFTDVEGWVRTGQPAEYST